MQYVVMSSRCAFTCWLVTDSWLLDKLGIITIWLSWLGYSQIFHLEFCFQKGKIPLLNCSQALVESRLGQVASIAPCGTPREDS